MYIINNCLKDTQKFKILEVYDFNKTENVEIIENFQKKCNYDLNTLLNWV